MARKKKTAAPEPELEIRADPEVIAEELEPVKPERSHTELMMLRGLGLLPPGEDFIPTSLFVSNNVLTAGMGGDLEADIDAAGIASFNIHGKAFTNIEELIVDIVPVQEGSGNPAPDNVRPITGWSEAKVMRSGKNLFDESQYQNLVTDYDYSSDGYHCKIIQLKPNTAYTISQRAGTADSSVVLLLNNNRRVNNGGYFDCRLESSEKTFTTDYTGRLYIGVWYSNDTAYNARFALCKIQIELGSTATAYEPYLGNTFTISLGDTRYGAVLDVTRGKLRVTHAYKVLNGTENWYAITSPANGFRNSGSTDFPGRKSGGEFICNRLYDKGNSLSDLTNTWDAVFASNLNIRTDSLFADADAFKAWVASNNLECVYELETPVEVDLTPANITALLGDNYIWADCGPVTQLEYSYDLLINQY